MAFIEERGGRYRVAFRFGGKLHRHNLGAIGRREAEGCLARVEENLRLVERGRLDVPEGADLGLFLVSDGRVAAKAKSVEALTLGSLRDGYLAFQAERQEANSVATLRLHLKHLVVTLGETYDLRRLDLAALERHVKRRAAMKGKRGRSLNAETIRKEIKTFAGAWKWATLRKLIDRPFPAVGLAYPKTAEMLPFQTRVEIEAQIARGLPADEVTALWRSLFLTLDEVREVLDLVRGRTLHRWFYVMMTIAAHTGMRRSEILRSRVTDFDLAGGTALVREKKRAKGKTTTRRVPISPFLNGVLRSWFEEHHPGGPWTISQGVGPTKNRPPREKPEPVTPSESDSHLRTTLGGTRWSMIGWHTFRHSFASNCAARGVDERLIDGWLGHTTEAMRRRYRHLLPDHQSESIRRVFGEG